MDDDLVMRAESRSILEKGCDPEKYRSDFHFICPGNVYNLYGELYRVIYCWSENAIEVLHLDTNAEKMCSPETIRNDGVFVGSNYKEIFND